MLSLQQQLLENLQQAPDLGDLKPNASRLQQISADSFTSNHGYNNPDSIYKSYYEALTSDKQQRKLWVLFNFPKAAQRDKNLLNLFTHICQFFESKEQIVEYNAIICASEVSKMYGPQIVNVLLPPLLKRLNSFPSTEYVICLKNLLPSLELHEIKKMIFPMIIEFMKNNEQYQHAGGMMLDILPLSKIGLTQDILDIFLSSPVFIANYLSPIIKNLSHIFGNDFISTFLIQKLIPITNSREGTREGAINAILTGLDTINDQPVYIFVLTAFNWASSNDSIALILIRHSDTILTKKHTDFPSKLREFANRIATSNNVNNRIHLCDELSRGHLLFQCLKGGFRNVFKSQAEDQDVNVRLNFLTNFSKLYSNNVCGNNSANERDFFYKLLIQFFNDSNVKVQEFLMSAQSIYGLFSSHLKIIVPLFLKLFERSISGNQWRHAFSCIKTCMTFPDDMIKLHSGTMCSIVNSAILKWPHPLSDQVIHFYIRLFQCNTSREANEEIMGSSIMKFAHNPSYSIRIIFIRLSFALSTAFHYEFFISQVWPNIAAMKNDVVASVRGALLMYLPRFRLLFKKCGDNETKMVVDSIFESMRNDQDPYVQEALKLTEEQLHLYPRHYCESSLPNFPVIGQQASSCSNMSGPLKNLPKIITTKSSEINKKKVSTKTATTSTPTSTDQRPPYKIYRRSSLGKKYTPKPSITTINTNPKSKLPAII
ncbi:hypothetical protein M9Y10_038577 [Tritrichomonas musculus]|uniref:Uncharacterized protein n=1 Tax=Tritrichomonas musculus TaxID=1915356 RepID=A0ABR2K8S7_9EUKA